MRVKSQPSFWPLISTWCFFGSPSQPLVLLEIGEIAKLAIYLEWGDSGEGGGCLSMRFCWDCRAKERELTREWLWGYLAGMFVLRFWKMAEKVPPSYMMYYTHGPCALEGYFHPPNLDLSNSGLKEFQQPEFEGYGPKASKNVSEDTSNEVIESPDAPMVEKLVSDDKLEKKNVLPTVAKIEFVRPKQQEKSVKYAKMYRSQASFVCGSFDHVQANCNSIKGKGWNMVPRAVLMKTGLRSLNTTRPVNTAHPKTTVYSARPMSHVSKSAQSTIKRPYQIRTTLTNKNFSQKVNTVKGKFYTARPKAVNTTRPNSAVVNVVRANQGHPQKKDQGYVDSGCSRHMTGNMSYVSYFKEFDRGYVTIGGGAKGGKITGKRTLKTDIILSEILIRRSLFR
ncbi:hypothetical protein Tco_1065107 [Tanacetum coccineum]